METGEGMPGNTPEDPRSALSTIIGGNILKVPETEQGRPMPGCVVPEQTLPAQEPKDPFVHNSYIGPQTAHTD
ncbi:MAG: hypothetical protein WAQ24_03050 [Candidatus Saccharimonadales bacterium]